VPCTYPIPAFRSSRCVYPKSGKPVLFFKEDSVRQWPGYESLQVPCGRCIDCRLRYSLNWAVRCVHEQQTWAEREMPGRSIFITLTYSPEFLPSDGSLSLEHFQNFMKRFRKRCKGDSPVLNQRTGVVEWPIRFFHCGEYGEKFGRPHYHALIFNFDFPDKVFLRSSPSGSRVYTSEILSELWPFGIHEIGDCNFDSAAYVARYITKKISGDEAEEHYSKCDEQGNFVKLKPEYLTMSRRPGIAKNWIDQFESDVFPHDFVVLRDGSKISPPKYYSRQFELTSPDAYCKLRSVRMERAKRNPDNAPERLRDRAIISKQKFSQLKRSYEHED